jgi:hypothetical protein
MMVANSNLISHSAFIRWPNRRVWHVAPVCESGSGLKGFSLLPTFYRLRAIRRSAVLIYGWMTERRRNATRKRYGDPTDQK